jgi:hypothetical protein
VLWERAIQVGDGHWQLIGLSDNYLRIHATSAAPCTNQVMNVFITGLEPDYLTGEILST